MRVAWLPVYWPPFCTNARTNSSALEENVEAIKRWERTILLARSRVEQVSDWIAGVASSGPVLVLHVLWFAV